MKTIYALVDPRTEQVRYVGATVDPQRRLREHLGRRCESTYCSRWIQELAAEGLKPCFWVLQIAGDEWQIVECQWIKAFRDLGAPLTNITDGGEGTSPGSTKSPETRAKMSIAATRWQTGRTCSPEHRASMSAERRHRLEDPGYRAQIEAQARAMSSLGGKAGKGKPKSVEHNAKVSASKMGVKLSSEHRAAISAGLRSRREKMEV